MSNLEAPLSWLGLPQYYDRFMQHGFDSWETLLEITEDDLEALDVDLGHRRRLQREIARTKSQAAHQTSDQPAHYRQQIYQPMKPQEPASRPITAEPEDLELVSPTFEPSAPAKRSYRHHPKPDTNTPERPYSAYVLFSNHIREQLKDKGLEFPEISRQVGRRWQSLTPSSKDVWRRKAAGPWEEYKAELAAYHKTETHSNYNKYVDDFNACQSVKGAGARDRKVRRSGGDAASAIAIQTSVDTNDYPTPGQTPAGTTRAFSNSSMASMAAPGAIFRRSGSPKAKMPITRLKIDERARHVDDDTRRTRSKQACEPCRQKKTKCNEARPTCGHCMELSTHCFYSNDKRDQEKRRLFQLSHKLGECQKMLERIKSHVEVKEQNLIQEALDLSPHDNDKHLSSNRNLPDLNAPPISANDTEGSDEGASVLGLKDFAQYVDGDDCADEASGPKPKAFSGQSSDVQWMQVLSSELNHDEGGQHRNHQRDSAAPGGDTSQEDTEASMFGNNVDSSGMPVKQLADALVTGYFETVHTSFPVLDRGSFMHQYNHLASMWHMPEAFEDRMFVTKMQLVFAIGAVHAHLSGTAGTSDERVHHLHFARARILAIDCGIFNDRVHLVQTQVFGLAAKYLLITNQINRSWNASGLAIRSAQSLGLHLQNSTPSLPHAQKELRASIWFALLAFERTLGVMTGRPSMVRDCDCSLPYPGQESTEPMSEEDGQISNIRSGPSSSRKASRTPMLDAVHVISQRSPIAFNSRASSEGAYFRLHVELTALAHEVVSQLYVPAVRQLCWSKIETTVDSFDDRLTAWKTRLRAPFDVTKPKASHDSRIRSFNVALAAQFQCVRTIINRPCLCRHERTALKQSSRNAVSRCVGSARAIIDIFITAPTTTLLNQAPQWWLLLYYLKRALTILLLELAFRAEHMPSEAGELLADAKKAIDWIHEMSSTSVAARHLFTTFSSLLVRAARRIGCEVADLGSRDDVVDSSMEDSQRTPSSAPYLHQPPMPTETRHYHHQSQNPNHMPSEPTFRAYAFGNTASYANHPIHPPLGRQTIHNVLEPQHFDGFSFEPMNLDSGISTSYFSPGTAATMGLIPSSHAGSTMPQQQTRQQQIQYGRGDGAKMDDWFAFDC